MDYTDVTTIAIGYSNRDDEETADNIDNFLRVMEAKVNRELRIGKMSIRADIDLDTPGVSQKYFDTPSDFGGLRSINYVNGAASNPLDYLNPSQMTILENSGNNSGDTCPAAYTNIAQQIQVYPAFDEGNLEIVYYQKVPPLTESEPNNWLSDGDPDCYIFGLLVEISSFAKDAEAALLWDGRFKEVLSSLVNEDAIDRWSGTPMRTRLG